MEDLDKDELKMWGLKTLTACRAKWRLILTKKKRDYTACTDLNLVLFSVNYNQSLNINW